jgi:anti-sigma B factor antagonist
MHRVEVEREDGTAVVSAAGELDAYAAPDLAAAFVRVTGEDRLIVDLGAVSFLDSTALGVVVRTIRAVDERRDRARIVLPTGPARRIFEITTLDRVLPVAHDRAEALASFTD